MLRRISLFLFLLFLHTEFFCTAIQAEFRLPPDDFVAGWKAAAKLKFVDRELYNYIDGAAEIFVEYGMNELTVQHYKKDNLMVTLEVYEMKRPESALGLYLVSCGTETAIEGIETRNSGDQCQFAMVKGQYFFRVNNFRGGNALFPVMVALAQNVLKTVPAEKTIQLFDLLPKENLVKGSERLIHGPVTLQQVYMFGEGDILQIEGKIYGQVAQYKDSPEEEFTRLVVPYPDEKAALKAYRNLVDNLDSYLKPEKRWENGFTFTDYMKKWGIVEVDGTILKIAIQLSKPPRLE